MPSHQPSRQPPCGAGAIATPIRFEASDALTWPFPQTQGSPVWQAWRAAQDAALADLRGSSWQAVGLRQVIKEGTVVRQRDAAKQRNTGVSANTLPADDRTEPVARSEHVGRQGERLERHFGPDLAARLRRAALETLGDVAMADTSGRQWWAMAPGIGPRRARAIVDRVHSLLEPGT